MRRHPGRKLGRVEDLDRLGRAGRRSCTARGTCPDARAAPAGPAGWPGRARRARDRHRAPMPARHLRPPPSCRRASRTRAPAAAPPCRCARTTAAPRRPAPAPGPARTESRSPTRAAAAPPATRAGWQETPTRRAGRAPAGAGPSHARVPCQRMAGQQRESRQQGSRYFACLPLTSENATRREHQPGGEETGAFFLPYAAQSNPEPRNNKPRKQDQRQQRQVVPPGRPMRERVRHPPRRLAPENRLAIGFAPGPGRRQRPGKRDRRAQQHAEQQVQVIEGVTAAQPAFQFRRPPGRGQRGGQHVQTGSPVPWRARRGRSRHPATTIQEFFFDGSNSRPRSFRPSRTASAADPSW